MRYQKQFILFAILFTAFFGFGSSANQKVDGTIYFEDGKTIDFYDFESVDMVVENQSVRSGKGKGLPVYFENSQRIIPYSKLKSIKVLNFEFFKDSSYRKTVTPCIQGTAEIKTVTGMVVTCWYFRMCIVRVTILDKLTGEIKNQSFPFKPERIKKLNIRKINFNN